MSIGVIGAAVRVASAGVAAVRSAVQGFDSQRAGKDSAVRSSVAIAPGVGISLDDEQLGRLSAAIDSAKAKGASRALVMLDGEALAVDVGLRTVTGRVNMQDARALDSFDAVITAPRRDDGDRASDLLAALGGSRR